MLTGPTPIPDSTHIRYGIQNCFPCGSMEIHDTKPAGQVIETI